MKLRALLVAPAVALAVVFSGGLLARAAEPPSSCQKILKRATGAVAQYARASTQVVRAQVGLLEKGKTATFSRELDAGEYVVFGVTDQKWINGFELSATDSKGKELKRAEGVDEGVMNLKVEAKDSVKIGFTATELGDGVKKGHFILVLLKKGDGAANPTDLIFEHAGDQAKELEDAGAEVASVEFDVLPNGKPLSSTRKLEAGSYALVGVSDEASVKDLGLKVASAAKEPLAADKRTDHIARVDLTSPGAEVNVTLYAEAMQEGVTDDQLVALLVARKK